jgi:cob(I)alamin adenosyltransferase
MPHPNIVTKTGDRGETSLWCGTRVPKTDCRIELVGHIDLALSALGRGYPWLLAGDDFCRELRTELMNIHRRFPLLMGEIATDDANKARFSQRKDSFSEADLHAIEAVYGLIHQRLNQRGDYSGGWKIYGEGGAAAADFYYARALFRQAELAAWRTHHAGYPLRPPLLQALNRMADLLFYLAVYLEEHPPQ